VDDSFEHERHYLVEYHTHIKDAAAKADRVCRLRRSKLDSLMHTVAYIPILISIPHFRNLSTCAARELFVLCFPLPHSSRGCGSDVIVIHNRLPIYTRPIVTIFAQSVLHRFNFPLLVSVPRGSLAW